MCFRKRIGIKEQRSKGNVDPKSVEKNHWELGQTQRGTTELEKILLMQNIRCQNGGSL